ncbi:large conductance mechanosensitive channel protein MscL [Dactylosporangium sp. CA-152071]|uniref:large conductance mechanosensitive channel protein MscL n=1 Tax=Dactylosporangium sp. CA-152071 TaxID=3239933 RepID=UPI003D8BE360
MRKLWAEFKAIAIGGSVLDLALGFIIGSAFATLVQSFVTNLFLQAVAAVVGEPDFQQLKITLHRTPIKYGVFLNDLLQFLLLAVALFVIIKFMTWIGVERGRSLDQRQCPFCYDRVPAAALICRSCGQQLVEDLPTLAQAEFLQDEREARRWPTLPALPPIVIPRRRPPTGRPPASEPPVDEPPVDEPPVDEPPVDEPPVDEPPVDEPPVDEPPVDEPPVNEPPVNDPTAGGPPAGGGASASGDETPAGRSGASATPAQQPPPRRRDG